MTLEERVRRLERLAIGETTTATEEIRRDLAAEPETATEPCPIAGAHGCNQASHAAEPEPSIPSIIARGWKQRCLRAEADRDALRSQVADLTRERDSLATRLTLRRDERDRYRDDRDAALARALVATARELCPDVIPPPQPPCGPRLKGFSLMFIVKADHPDVPFTINPPTVTDSEGNPVDPGTLRYLLSSDNVDVVSLSLGDDGVSGTAHFGAPGFAAINVVVEPADGGEMLGSFGAQFTVTAGDPAAIVGGSITFDGLTEA